MGVPMAYNPYNTGVYYIGFSVGKYAQYNKINVSFTLLILKYIRIVDPLPRPTQIDANGVGVWDFCFRLPLTIRPSTSV